MLFCNASKPWEWFRSKELGFRTSWFQEMLNGVSLLVKNCFRDRIWGAFYIALWSATKNGSTTIMPRTENHGEYPDMPPRQRPDRVFTVPRLCSAFGGTSSVWCIMSYWNRVQPSRGIGTKCNWCVWAERWRRNSQSIKRDIQSYPPAWQCSATCRKTGQDILGNAEMRSLIPPAVLSRRCFFRLPFLSIDGTRLDHHHFPH